MRNLPDALKDRFAQEDLSVCRCLKLTLTTGAVYYITDLTRVVPYAGKDYLPSPAIDVSAVRLSKELGAQNAEVILAYDGGVFNERQIRFGKLNDALAELTYVDYRDPGKGGTVILSGKVSEVEQPSRSYCILQLSSAISAGQSTLFAEVYSKRCRNIFGDKRCKVDIEALSTVFTVIRNFPDLASFAINGYTDPSNPPAVPQPPTANGTYTQAGEGTYELTVPRAQILKVKMKSSGGGGGSSGLAHERASAGMFDFAPGVNGTPGYESRFGNLFEMGPGAPGVGNLGAYRPDIFSFLILPPQAEHARLNPGPVTPDLFTPGAGGLGGKGGSFTQYLAAAGGGGVYNGSDAPGGMGGNGSYLEHTFYLEDPACPIKWGDKINITIGAPGIGFDLEGSGWEEYREGARGAEGSFTLEWSSNVGEEVLPETFNLGSVLWLTGDNAGQVIQVAENTGGVITLANSPRMPINPGDTGKLRPGCSNFADMCENKYNNLVNMQAEPVTPQGATTMPSPIADTVQDLSKPPVAPTNTGFPSGGAPYAP